MPMRLPKKSLTALGLLLATTTAMADMRPHFVATAGISYGGDTLAKIHYANGEDSEVKAGGLFYLAAGAGLEFTGTPWSLQLLLGHHRADSAASNGDIAFTRNTVDLQGFYRIGDHRIGLGLMRHLAPEYTQSGFSQPDSTVKFHDAGGISLEYNWLPPASKFGISARAAHIGYDVRSIDGAAASGSVSGDFLALGLYLYL
jgi:hypothetical protein